jgi:hypothetical protein
MNKCHSNTELSSHEGTRCQFNGGKALIKLGIDVHQDFYVVVEQEDGANPKPPQRFLKQAFLHWAATLKSRAAEVHAVYEACGFGFRLQRNLSALGIHCYVTCPQKLDEQNRRVKTDGLDAKGALATGAARKKAIVAVARQLAVDLWRIRTGRLRAEEVGLIN